MKKKEANQTALTIAGSDPSGGAGIQADIKTFTDIGVYGGAAITCLTAQNTQGVFAIEPVDPAMIKEQITRVLEDLNVTHIKIGMLGSITALEAICDALSGYVGEVIVDPVLQSTSGRDLIAPEAYNLIREQLLHHCTVITPNMPELSILTGEECSTRDELLNAGEKLLDGFDNLRSVIITGGHIEPERNIITDFMLSSSFASHSTDRQEISHQRIDSRNTHGTGCTFSAAFTAFHLLTGDDTESFRKSVEYMDNLLKASVSANIGSGTGPLMHHLK
jgi:hydroxymethylpyrimidine/phosphomethylpyrimidine kinase